jgi:hypothetical protein
MHCNSQLWLLTPISFIPQNTGRPFIDIVFGYVFNLQYDIYTEQRVLKGRNEVSAGYIVYRNGVLIETFFDRSSVAVSDNMHLNSISHYGSKSEDIVLDKAALQTWMLHTDY